jgi:hypothetical protein
MGIGWEMRPAVDASRVFAVIRGLLAEYPEPLGAEATLELRARLVDLDEVREWFAGHPEVQELCATVLRRAGGQEQMLAAASDARRALRSAETLRRFRWALWGVAEAGLRVHPSAHPAADDVEAWWVGGHVLGDQSRLREASVWFGRVLEVKADHVEARALHAWTRWLLDMEPGWVEEVASLAAAHPESALLAGLAKEMSPSGPRR